MSYKVSNMMCYKVAIGHYFLKDDKHFTYVFNHLVLAFKFSLPPTTHMVKGAYATYELSNDAINHGYNKRHPIIRLNFFVALYSSFEKFSRRNSISRSSDPLIWNYYSCNGILIMPLGKN